ncbi:MAG: acyltransferase [Gammaproteobacteria bacterium]|nr:acyltransferase [Gammaproteobacteria bacterium]MDP2349515.1 acyltransferase [Gammaproteobacteria bacterium]
MKSSNIGYIPSVDHLRGFAAILVVIFHGLHYISHGILYDTPFDGANWPVAPDIFTSLLIEGHTAVSLFFVISGFIFTYGALGKKIIYVEFLRNRFLRTYPLFLVLLTCGLLLNLENFNVIGLLKTVFFMANYPGAFNGDPFTFVYWSIAVEWQFYLVFPVLMFLVNRFGVLVLPAIILAFLLTRFYQFDPAVDMRATSYWTMMGRADQFLVGMIAGYVYANSKSTAKVNPLWLPAATLLVLTSIFVFNRLGGGGSTGYLWIFWPTIEAAVWAIFLLIYVAVARRFDLRVSSVLVLLGTISYSIYLTHYVVLHVLMTNGWDTLIQVGGPLEIALLNTLLVAIPIVLGLSVITFSLFEKPFFRFRGKYI